MVGCARRFATRAIAAQVGGDDGEPLGQRRRDPVPHQVRLRDAVQKQDRLPGPTPDAMDCGLRRRDVELIETLEHRGKRYPQVTTCAHRPAAREHRRRRPSLFGAQESTVRES